MTKTNIKYSIYKYFRFDKNFRSSILNSYLWFSKAGELNDPFEFNIKTHATPKELNLFFRNLKKEFREKYGNKHDKDIDELLCSCKIDSEILHNLLMSHFIKAVNTLGICCFSEVATDTLMWTHYADSHKGLIVEFDFLKLYKSILKLNKQTKYIQFDEIGYVKDFPNTKVVFGKSELNSEIKKRFFTKLEKWMYEKEIRFISNNPGRTFFDRSAIKSVILGPRMSKSNSRIIEKLLSRIDKSRKIKIRNMKIDNEKGKLTIE